MKNKEQRKKIMIQLIQQGDSANDKEKSMLEILDSSNGFKISEEDAKKFEIQNEGLEDRMEKVQEMDDDESGMSRFEILMKKLKKKSAR